MLSAGKYSRFILLIIVLCVFLKADGYEIQQLEVSFEPALDPESQKMRDIHVNARIEYGMDKNQEILGKIDLGEWKAVDLQAPASSDTSNITLSANGNRIQWLIPASENEGKIAHLDFRIPYGLLGTKETNSFKAEWLGGWEVPVRKLKITFWLPDGFEPTRLEERGRMGFISRIERDGRKGLMLINENIGQGHPIQFHLLFSPGLVKNFGPLRISFNELFLGFIIPLFFFVSIFYFVSRRILSTIRFSRLNTSKRSHSDSRIHDLGEFKAKICKLKINPNHNQDAKDLNIDNNGHDDEKTYH